MLARAKVAWVVGCLSFTQLGCSAGTVTETHPTASVAPTTTVETKEVMPPPAPRIVDTADDALFVPETSSAELQEALKAYRAGDARTAAIVFQRLAAKTDNPPEERLTSSFYFAKALCTASYAAACAIELRVALGSGVKYRAAAAPWIAYLVDVLADTEPLEPLASGYDAAEIAKGSDLDVQDRLYFLIGRERRRSKDLASAEVAFSKIRPGSRWYAQATLVRAFMASAMKQQDKSIQLLAEAEKAWEALLAAGPDERQSRMLDLTRMTLARILYGKGAPEDLARALALYARIDKNGPSKEDAIFEAGWCLQRSNRAEEGLAGLATLSADYRARNPESAVLTGYLLSQTCKTDEAIDALDLLSERGEVIAASLDIRAKSPAVVAPGEPAEVAAAMRGLMAIQKSSPRSRLLSELEAEQARVRADSALQGTPVEAHVSSALATLTKEQAATQEQQLMHDILDLAAQYRKQREDAMKLTVDVSSVYAPKCAEASKP